jgi:hypothetical protein
LFCRLLEKSMKIILTDENILLSCSECLLVLTIDVFGQSVHLPGRANCTRPSL